MVGGQSEPISLHYESYQLKNPKTYNSNVDNNASYNSQFTNCIEIKFLVVAALVLEPSSRGSVFNKIHGRPQEEDLSIIAPGPHRTGPLPPPENGINRAEVEFLLNLVCWNYYYQLPDI